MEFVQRAARLIEMPYSLPALCQPLSYLCIRLTRSSAVSKLHQHRPQAITAAKVRSRRGHIIVPGLKTNAVDANAVRANSAGAILGFKRQDHPGVVVSNAPSPVIMPRFTVTPPVGGMVSTRVEVSYVTGQSSTLPATSVPGPENNSGRHRPH